MPKRSDIKKIMVNLQAALSIRSARMLFWVVWEDRPV